MSEREQAAAAQEAAGAAFEEAGEALRRRKRSGALYGGGGERVDSPKHGILDARLSRGKDRRDSRRRYH